ncbi:MAG: 7-cyano-7-deazaguanine synthase [Planctomycetaceae bacterium]|nr:7-cyano-7-deazaguanine synthase [Planctomycetaceae bacterium]
MNSHPSQRIGLLYSGGLDSAVLLGHLLEKGRTVRPFYVRSGMHWEDAERRAAIQYLGAFRSSRIEPLVELTQDVGEVYGAHWSLHGQGVPDASTEDEAVYLPGRNLLLISKAALWCQLNGIHELALAILASNPFPDATGEFFTALERTLELATGEPLRVVRPFAELSKPEVMRLGRDFPLELSFSCIDPQGGLHCGACNKCAERQAAFSAAEIPDRTRYARRWPSSPTATPGA